MGFAAFTTGFDRGDALYRDLETHLANAEHWHAGLYTGFGVDASGNGVMTGVHATGDLTQLLGADTVAIFRASRGFSSPSTDVADTMEKLRDDFVKVFAPTTAFHGARRPPAVTPGQRVLIPSTAQSMFAKGISYTFADMLDYKWFDWDGTVTDIDEVRCDGIVEYAYERNGVRVCGGLDPTRWNIATPGTDNPENHNDFHNHSYNPGELCPRIQAGDEASDTTFAPASVNAPVVADFDAFSFTFIFVPSVWFRVTTGAYSRALVRLLVSKDGGPFYFVRTEDPYGGTSPPAIVGGWEWVTVPANTSGRQFGWWMGKTVGGPDYLNRNGLFEFRLVAVDGGGNVSELKSRQLRIEWHGSRIECIRKDVREDPDRSIQSVGGIHPDGRRWELGLRAAIEEVESGQAFYVERPPGDRVAVEVAVSRRGRKYLKTVADGDVPNNLLALPECPR
jgi:hypothetical protein